jgi:hypothetical protein
VKHPGPLVHAYSPADWTGFFAAVTGAAAALAGLLFVAVSINLEDILREGNKDENKEENKDGSKNGNALTNRAAETLAVVLFVVFSSALVLVPQALALLGAEILVIAIPLAVVTTWDPLRYRRQHPDDPLLWTVSRMMTTGVALLPGLLGGISLAAHWGGGLYWLVPASLLGIAGAVYSAWVMLVEIKR